MFFKDIKGKDKLTSELRTNVDRGRIPHAQLLLSKEGTGGLAVAFAYAS